MTPERACSQCHLIGAHKLGCSDPSRYRMTPERLAEIEARANAAAEGQWIAEYGGDQGSCVTTSDAYSAVRAAEGKLFKAERSLAAAAESAQYVLEDYADRPAIASLLDAITAYREAENTRRAASDTLSAAFRKDLG